MSVPTPADLRYTASHEWVRDDSGLVTVGITDHAQDALGELVYVELPAIGRAVKQGEAIVVVESTKAASDVYAPVDGEVVEVNAALSDTPQSVNEAPYGAGWLLKIKPSNAAQLQALMDATTYSQSAKD
jgi:glycine cleavage system H protein